MQKIEIDVEAVSDTDWPTLEMMLTGFLVSLPQIPGIAITFYDGDDVETLVSKATPDE